MQISITTTAPLVRQGLENLSAELPQVGRRRIYDAMNRITREMEGYPPERPGQRYRRTGLLGASWDVKPLNNGYTVTNDAKRKGRSYGRYVVGDAYGTGQAWMHKGRWQKLRDVVDAEVKNLPDAISDDIRMVARRDGLEAR